VVGDPPPSDDLAEHRAFWARQRNFVALFGYSEEMNCETCGNPVDRQDAERGACAHCGVVLPHVLRAAEKAEFVRRVVAQGHNVRIDGDRMEAGAPPGPPRAGPDGAIIETRAAPIVFALAAAMVALSIGAFSYFLMRPEPPREPPRPAIAEPTRPVHAPPRVPVDPVTTATATKKDDPPKDTSEPAPKAPPPNRAPALPRSVDGVIAANKAQYDRCQRAEIAQNPAAPRRYSVAVTVDGQGRAEWVELLSEASAEMKACVQSVTRGIDFPKPSAGSSRSIVTLSFAGAP
jgi:hypothetical protein